MLKRELQNGKGNNKKEIFVDKDIISTDIIKWEKNERFDMTTSVSTS